MITHNHDITPCIACEADRIAILPIVKNAINAATERYRARLVAEILSEVAWQSDDRELQRETNALMRKAKADEHRTYAHLTNVTYGAATAHRDARA